MQFIETKQGFLLRGAEYEARVLQADVPVAVFAFDGREIAELAMVSTLDGQNKKEKLTEVRIAAVDREGETLRVELTAQSNVWESRRFVWVFEQERATYRHYAQGKGDLGRCYFFSSGRPGLYDAGDSDGYHTNAAFLTPYYHTFNSNLANVTDFDISQPGFVGVGRSECVGRADYINMERYYGIFSPAPLCFAFYHEQACMGLGIGAKPGDYRFNGLEYSGCLKYASCFYVQYMGYTHVDGCFESPEAVLNFDYAPFGCLKRYVDWIDERGYGTDFRFDEAAWHRQPIFCGWAEQTALCPSDMEPADRATQANYEQWVEELDSRGIPYGTIVIDDKWQKEYGTFEVDREKWPDMAGFVRRQHEKGKRVLLWIPAYQIQGIPEAYCTRDETGKPLFAAVGYEPYDRFVRESVIRLVQETDIDGFKEDWIGRTGDRPGLENYPLHGLEMVRRFQFVVHDALHQAKPDALLETQTPNPLFRESSDMLRLNDIWFATRNLSEMMRERARIARVAGWKVLDCDNASPTTMEEWINYAQVQPHLGVPSLYFLTETESSHEHMEKGHSDFLASIWHNYIERNGL